MGFFHLLSFTSILERLLGHGPWLFSWEVCRQNCGKKYFLARGDVFFFLGWWEIRPRKEETVAEAEMSQKVALFMV